MVVVYQQTPNPDDLKKKQDKKDPKAGASQGLVGWAFDQAKPDPARIKKIEQGKKKS